MTKKKKGTKSSKSKERGDEDFDFSERRNVFKVTENFEPSLNDAFALIESVKTKKGETLLHSMDILFPEGSVTGELLLARTCFGNWKFPFPYLTKLFPKSHSWSIWVRKVDLDEHSDAFFTIEHHWCRYR